MSVAMGWAGGGFGSEDFGSPMNIGIAVLVFLAIALINHYGPSRIAPAAVLIGAAIGYVVCIPLGLVDFGQVVAAEWFALPQFFKFGVPFQA